MGREKQEKRQQELEQQRLELLKAQAQLEAQSKLDKEEKEKRDAEAKQHRAWLVEERQERTKASNKKREEERKVAAPGVVFKPSVRVEPLDGGRDSWLQSSRQLYGRGR